MYQFTTEEFQERQEKRKQIQELADWVWHEWEELHEEGDLLTDEFKPLLDFVASAHLVDAILCRDMEGAVIKDDDV